MLCKPPGQPPVPTVPVLDNTELSLLSQKHAFHRVNVNHTTVLDLVDSVCLCEYMLWD